MRSSYLLPIWMIDQVNQKEKNQLRMDSEKSSYPDRQKDKKKRTMLLKELLLSPIVQEKGRIRTIDEKE